MKVTLDTHTVDITEESLLEVLNKVAVGRAFDKDKDEAFHVVDLSDVFHKHRLFAKELPRVEPFYAVKCNEDPAILSLLVKLGIGFDCASKAELQRVLGKDVHPSRIVYANPCKQLSHIQYAAEKEVTMMTFDSEEELYKVKAAHPQAKMLIRMTPPDNTKAKHPLGTKFGATLKSIPRILQVAKQLAVDVIGVSFHVGSGCDDGATFYNAISLARRVFDMGENAGFHFDLLDIGGGFPGSADIFVEVCTHVRPALNKYFPDNMGVRIIAEPGRYFVASCSTLAVNVIGKKMVSHVTDEAEQGVGIMDPVDKKEMKYYLNDGIYGSFNCLFMDGASDVIPEMLRESGGEPDCTSSLWGPTCDGLDCILAQAQLPELQVGEWLYFRNFGAYTVSVAPFQYSGVAELPAYYKMQKDHWDQVKGIVGATKTAMGTSGRLPCIAVASAIHPNTSPKISEPTSPLLLPRQSCH